MLRKIFEPKRNTATGEWRRLHNEELYALYFSRNIIRVIRSRKRDGRNAACIGSRTGLYRIYVEKTEGNRPLGRPTCRWENNNKIEL
jgi:hypothetical protein